MSDTKIIESIKAIIEIMKEEGNKDIKEIDYYDPNDRGTHIKIVRSV